MYYSLKIPPTPYFDHGGVTVFQAGDGHMIRTAVGVFVMILVEKGTLYMTDGDVAHQLGPGQVLILDPWQTHFSHKPCPEVCRIHWLHFHADCFAKTDDPNDVFEDSQHVLQLPVVQQLNKTHFHQLLQMWDELMEWRSDPVVKNKMKRLTEMVPATPLRQQQLFLQILDSLSQTALISQHQVAKNIMTYLQKNYSFQLTLEELAEFAHCHPSHVIKSFKKAYHCTPFQALLKIRLKQSESLLISTQLPIEKIAFQTGFQSAAYFTKCFREKIGMTPKVYRQTVTAKKAAATSSPPTS